MSFFRAIDLISKLLAFDPAERFSAREALAHPFFDELFVAGNMENLDTRDIKFDVTDDKLIEFVEKSCGGIPK
jgi:serine/threonine protein kinase